MPPTTQLAPPPDTQPFRLDEAGWPVIPPTRLTIHRTSPLDEQSRQIACRLDGERIAVLLFGHDATVEIAPGQHVLRVHNTLHWRTLPFDAPPGAHVHVTVYNRSTRWYYPLLLIVGAAPLYLEVHRGPPERS